MNFRHQARQAIARAKVMLEDNSVAPEHLRYAVLDVRMAMEALTYERAHSYRKELPESAYETWQPRKLMQVLLDIDPNADRDSSLRIGREETYGVPATEIQDLGHETVLNMGKLKKHYDALGSYLHMPTLKQLQADGGMSLDKLRTRLDEIIAYVDAVLSSPIFTINFGTSRSRLVAVARRKFVGGYHATKTGWMPCVASAMRLTSSLSPKIAKSDGSRSSTRSSALTPSAARLPSCGKTSSRSAVFGYARPAWATTR